MKKQKKKSTAIKDLFLDRPTSHGGWPDGHPGSYTDPKTPVNKQIADYLKAMGLVDDDNPRARLSEARLRQLIREALSEATIKILDGPERQVFNYTINSFEDLDLAPDIKEYLSNMFATNDPEYTQQALELLTSFLELPSDNLTQSEIEDYVDENLSEVITAYLDREWYPLGDWDDRQIYIDEMVEQTWVDLDNLLDDLMATIVGLSLIENPPLGGNPMGIAPDQSFKGLQNAIKILYNDKFAAQRNSNASYKMDADVALAKFIREMTFLNSGYITWEMIEKELRESADKLW